jgi:hypothetical protein
MSHMALARPPRQPHRHRPASNLFMRIKTAMTRLVLEVFWPGVISPTTDGTIYGPSPGCGRFSKSASGAVLKLYYPGQQGGEQRCHCD